MKILQVYTNKFKCELKTYCFLYVYNGKKTKKKPPGGG